MTDFQGVVLKMDQWVRFRDNVGECSGIDGQIIGIERDKHGFETYWVYSERLTALIKAKRHELVEADKQQANAERQL